MKFTILTRTKWDEPPRARHQVANSLSKLFEVSFIEANHRGFPALNEVKLFDKLVLYSPYYYLDNIYRFRLPLFNELYQKWLYKELGQIKSLDVNNPLIVFDHTCHLIAKNWPGMVIYFCNDDHLRSYGIPFLRKYFEFTENKLAKSVDFIFVTSESLKKKFSKYSSKAHLIKLAAPSIGDGIKLSFKNKSKIKVAWVGFAGKKNDISIIKKILSHYSDIELHFFGVIKPSVINDFKRFSNFFYHGIETGNELYQKLNNCTVGIAPYSLDDINSGRTPNKLWLYLAVGLPVVVTNLHNIRNWQFPDNFVYRSVDNKDFIDLIIEAHEDNTSNLFQRRIQYAKENTWDHRIKVILSIIQK